MLKRGDLLRKSVLTEGDVDHSPPVFQMKTMQYHIGLLTERGSEPSDLGLITGVWRLSV